MAQITLTQVMAEIKKSNRQLEGLIEKKFKGVDRKFEGVDKRLSSLEKDMKKVLQCVSAENADEFPAIKRGAISKGQVAIAAKGKS